MLESQSVFSMIQQGGISLFPLGICSVLVVAVIFERLKAFRRLGKPPRELMRRVESLLASGDWQGATRVLDESPSPYARVAKAGLLRWQGSPQEIADTLTLASDAEIAAAGRGLPVLGTIGNIAPFIGLFGTVVGIMRAFHEVANRKSAEASAISGGIAEALIATAVGLAVGIAAVVANNWCHAIIEGYRLELERFATEWAYSLEHLQKRAPREMAESAK